MTRRSQLLLIVLLLSVSILGFAQSETHLSDSPAKALFRISSWSHGYMHGYESGFHKGNLDLHMARDIRDPHAVKDFRQAGSSYRPEFGDRTEYESGFQSGFEVGYLDGATGKDFRAASETIQLSNDLDRDAANPTKDEAKYFDRMLSEGYREGRRIGLSDGRSGSTEMEGSNFGECPELAAAPDSCGAYRVGYRWGYSDGMTNQRTDSGTQRASR